MGSTKLAGAVVIALPLFVSLPCLAQENGDAKIKRLEQRLSALEDKLRRAESKLGATERKVRTIESTIREAVNTDSAAGLILLLYAVFCALWAQNTGRNSWLWFFLGLFFSVFTVFVLLVKNSRDRSRETKDATAG